VHFTLQLINDEILISVNRSISEDAGRVITDEALAVMLSGLDYHKIKDELGDESPLAIEIWRVFLALMAIALIAEAALCLG